MIRRGRGNTLIVAKLDRLSRSLKDVCTLVEELFGDERYHLLSLCGMVNTHSEAGRMVLMNLANFSQYERELTSERTRAAFQFLLDTMAYGGRNASASCFNARGNTPCAQPSGIARAFPCTSTPRPRRYEPRS